LYDILCQHPQVYFPFVKEPAFFCDEEYYARGVGWYLETFFEDAREQPVRGEATSRYLYFANKTARRIYEFSKPGLPGFIALFRDPAKLVYSFYWNSIREGHESLSFEKALQSEPERMKEMQTWLENKGQILYAYSRIGNYSQQIMQYLALFPKDKFLFLLTEDLLDFPALITHLQVFLNINDHSSTIRPASSNNSALPRSRKLHNWLRNRSALKDIFKRFIPFSIRYKFKESALEMNLRGFSPPVLDAETANSIRKQYSDETKRLQDIIGRDLSKWLPV
jgi:hypothetical protein